MPEDEELVEPFRVTPGFVAFVGLLCLPALVAVAIFFGAWLVSNEVYAAREAEAADGPFAAADGDVAEWKKALVGVCPLH